MDSIPGRRPRNLAARAAPIALLLALATAEPCHTQEPRDSTRVPLFGRITPHEGTTWTDAMVHVVSIGPPWRVDASEDILAIPADADGRFRIDVFAGRSYSVWASTKTPTGARITDLVRSARGGVAIRLHEQDPIVASKIRVEGFDAWREQPELRYRIAVLGSYAVATGPLRLDDEGCFDMPALPPGRTFLNIVDATGCVALPQTPLPATSVTLLNPLSVSYRLVDRDDGKPVGGATLLRLDDVDQRWREVGLTDADGTCVVRDGGPCEWGEAIFVHAPGYRELASIKAGTRGDDGKPITAIELRLVKAEPIRGRIFVSEGVAARSMPLILACSGVFEDGYVGGSYRSIATKEDGRFALSQPGYLDEPGPPWQFSVFAALRPSELEIVDRATRDPSIDESAVSPLYPYVPLVFDALSKDPARRFDLGDVNLTEWTRVDVTAITSDRRPARFASLHLNIANAGSGNRTSMPATAITDSRGRLSIILPPKHWILGVHANGETAVSDIDLTKANSLRKPLHLELQAPHIVRGIVVDSDERPIEGSVVRWSWRSSDRRFGLGHVLESMARVVRSDASGRFELAVPAACNGCSVDAYSASRYATPVDVDLSGDPIDRLTIVLPKTG